jgi:predicted nucleic acid-binding protein
MTESYKKCFIDSNIWLYSFIETQDITKANIAKSILRNNDITISTQVIKEVCINLIRKACFSKERIRNIIEAFYNKYTVMQINKEIL